MKRKGGLGRGLESLIPNTRVGATNGEDAGDLDQAITTALAARRERLRSDSELAYHDLPLDLIDPNPRQPRGAFDEQELAELTASVKAVGVLQPVVVRPAGVRFQLIMGERRMRAAQAAGLATIPAVVRDTAEEHLLRDALL